MAATGSNVIVSQLLRGRRLKKWAPRPRRCDVSRTECSCQNKPPALMSRKQLDKPKWRDIMQNPQPGSLAACAHLEIPKKNEEPFQIRGLKEAGPPDDLGVTLDQTLNQKNKLHVRTLLGPPVESECGLDIRQWCSMRDRDLFYKLLLCCIHWRPGLIV